MSTASYFAPIAATRIGSAAASARQCTIHAHGHTIQP